jgi:hypothetical protein
MSLGSLWKTNGTLSAPKLTCLGGRGIKGLDRGTSCTMPSSDASPAIVVDEDSKFIVEIGSTTPGVNVLGSLFLGYTLDITKSVFKTINGDVTMNSVPMGITHKEGALTFPELTAINGTLFSNPDFIKNDDPWPTLDFPK